MKSREGGPIVTDPAVQATSKDISLSYLISRNKGR